MQLTEGAGEQARRLSDELDRLPITRLHILILVGCCVGFSFDLAEVAFGNILSAVFSTPPNAVSGWQLSGLLAAVYVGAAVGAPCMGWLSDRFGRRLTLLWTLAILFVASLFAAAAPGIGSLLLSRLVAGLSLGAYPPLMFAYLTDVLPPGRRGGLIVTSTAISYIGPPAFIFLVRWLTPINPLGIDAWRWGFLVAAIGVAACAAGFWLLPESPRWLIQKQRFAEAEAILEEFRTSRTIAKVSPPVQLKREEKIVESGSSGRSLAKQAIFLLVLYFLTPWATVGFALLSGAVLVQKGINVQDSLLYIGISTFGPLVGTLAGGFLIERAERRTFLVVNAVGMAVAGILFGLTEIPLWLVASALVFNLIVALFLPVLVLYASESVPTENRGKLTSWAWTANRVGSALVPVALLPVLHVYGPTVMFVVIAGTLVAFVAILLVFGSRGAARRRVD